MTLEQIVERLDAIERGQDWRGDTIRALAGLKLDMEVWRTGVMPAVVAAPGSGVIDVKRLADLLKRSAEGDVAVAFSDHFDAKVAAFGHKARIPGLAPEDFPARPVVPDQGLTIEASAFRRVVGDTSVVINPIAGQYYTRGVLLIFDKQSIAAVSTDGHQMVYSRMKTDIGGWTEPTTALVAKKGLTEAVALGGDTIAFGLNEYQHQVFQSGADVVVARALESNFPQWERMIQRRLDSRLTTSREAFAAAVERVRLAAKPKGPTMTLAFASDGLTLKCQSAERGEAEELVDATLHGKPVTFCLNPDYVLDFLKTASTDVVSCEIKDELTAAHFRTVEDVTDEYVHLIMPMRG